MYVFFLQKYHLMQKWIQLQYHIQVIHQPNLIIDYQIFNRQWETSNAQCIDPKFSKMTVKFQRSAIETLVH